MVTASGSVTVPAKVGLVAVRPSRSVAVTAKANGPFAVGVPPITPVAGASVRPAGRVPAATAKVSAPRPPVATTGVAYATPLLSGGTLAVATASGSTTVPL